MPVGAKLLLGLAGAGIAYVLFAPAVRKTPPSPEPPPIPPSPFPTFVQLGSLVHNGDVATVDVNNVTPKPPLAFLRSDFPNLPQQNTETQFFDVRIDGVNSLLVDQQGTPFLTGVITAVSWTFGPPAFEGDVARLPQGRAGSFAVAFPRSAIQDLHRMGVRIHDLAR